jgi:heme/copper-type cytochrome/quinol oxidase subunit 3
MNEPRLNRAAATLDVSMLAPGAFGHRSLMWWGTLGLMLIEGTAFALAIGAYLFFRTRVPSWPPDGIAPPDLTWGTVNTVILLVSCIPNQLARNAAERVDLKGVRLWLVAAIAVGIAFNAVRVQEFMTLNVLWNTDAYGSIVWLLLGLHTTHILTDVVDTIVLAALMFIGPIEERRFVDVEENSLYWYFVVGAWLPIYGVIYWLPRLL